MRALALLLVLAGCECAWGDKPSGLVIKGPFPEGTYEQIDKARAKCGRRLIGTIEFIDGDFPCGTYPPAHVQGCSDLSFCWIEAKVRYQPLASQTSLLEEIGHYCLSTHEDAPVQKWMETL